MNFQKTSNSMIVFTATMSAGKSTLINALMGREIANTKKAACTATVMDFLTSPSENTRYSVVTDKNEYLFATVEDINDFIKGRLEPCSVIGHFLSILSKRKVTLTDTPGVNSSQNPKHKQITREALMNNDNKSIVYVIPVDNYGSEDDYYHLKFIQQKAKYRHIYFVVNMMDTCDLEDDSVQEIVSDIEKHLSDIGFDKPSVFPISAKAGLLLKRALSGEQMHQNDINACQTFVSTFLQPELDLGKYFPDLNEVNLEATSFSMMQEISKERLLKAYYSTGLPGLEQFLVNMMDNEESSYAKR